MTRNTSICTLPVYAKKKNYGNDASLVRNLISRTEEQDADIKSRQ